MIRASGVHHVAIKARDVERVAAFYRDVLGLPEQKRFEEHDRTLRSVWLKAGVAILMVERASVSPPRESADFFVDRPGLHLLAFEIRAVDRPATRKRLDELGVAIVHETDFTLYVLDPEGNRVGLSSYPDRG